MLPPPRRNEPTLAPENEDVGRDDGVHGGEYEWACGAEEQVDFGVEPVRPPAPPPPAAAPDTVRSRPRCSSNFPDETVVVVVDVVVDVVVVVVAALWWLSLLLLLLLLLILLLLLLLLVVEQVEGFGSFFVREFVADWGIGGGAPAPPTLLLSAA